MQSNQHEQRSGDEKGQVLAFCGHLLRNSIFHRMGRPMDALPVHRFQALGLLGELQPQSLPADTKELLLNPDHPKRVPLPDGPLVFIRDGEGTSVAEVGPLLLNANYDVRNAAFQYFQNAMEPRDSIMTPCTMALFANKSSDILSSDIHRWRTAAIELVDVLRNDLFGHIAGLRQSLAANFEDGRDKYVQLVMRPSFESLAHLLPPIWSATEQRSHLKDEIERLAQQPTLEAALSEYYDLCGFLPLCTELGANQLATRWTEQHSDATVSWDDIALWAKQYGSPLARYHAITVALGLPAARLSSFNSGVWDEVFWVLDSGAPVDVEADSQVMWTLYCELASHFARHIETLHPGQDGERIACCAWWLAERVGRIFGKSPESAKSALEEIVKPEAMFSLSRWSISRSPVTPSGFRFVTLFARSVWALSLIAHLARGMQSSNVEGIPQACREKLTAIIEGYLVTAPITDDTKIAVPVFAVEEQVWTADLLKKVGVQSPEQHDTISELARVRGEIADIEGLKSRLRRFGKLSESDQQLTMLLLRAITFSSLRYDDTISEWLDGTDCVIASLRQVPESVLEPMIEALGEFQLRPRVGWPIRLPHVLACANEETEDLDRFAILHVHTLLMSINVGIVSPIQRTMCSKWRAESLSQLRIWRENIVEAGRFSEPWVAARVRSTSAAISRLIGPRTSQFMLSDVADQIAQ